MKRVGLALVFVFPLSLLASGFALAADDSKVKAATEQVERGAKKIPDGKIGQGVEETSKGIGNTVSEGAKYSGEAEGRGGRPPSRPRRVPGAMRAIVPSASGTASRASSRASSRSDTRNSVAVDMLAFVGVLAGWGRGMS
jgi:hypothetical protein